jgi:3-deoxy-D-manno-octulosonic-acid transferase
MRLLYRLAYLPALMVAGPYYLRRMFQRGGYGQDFKQRFGYASALPPKRAGVSRIWIQAVSVGEILAIGPLLQRLKQSGRAEVVLTTTTSTGYAIAKERYRETAAAVMYFPLDFWLFSRRAWNRIQPDVVVLAESEVWPEHLWQAEARGVPAVLINARLSDRSYRRLLKGGMFATWIYDPLSRVLACSAEDAERFVNLGVPEEKVEAVGNLKLDVDLGDPLSAEQRQLLRAELGLPDDCLLLLGSSTWPGEEAMLLAFLEKAREAGRPCRLLIVPRHAERRAELEQLMSESRFAWHLRSRGPASGPVDVCVADTTGELRRLTQLADLVFCGKSMPPHEGGQTPVEAAALGKPLVFGPRMTNFRTIARGLVDEGAAQVVGDDVDFHQETLRLLSDPAARERMAAAAREWRERNRGAVERTVAAVLAAAEQRVV